MQGDAAMWKKLSALAIFAFILLITPLQVIAQQTQQPAGPPQGYYWPGPWHMWNDGYAWPFWWIGPAMMGLFMLVVFGAIFFFARGACGFGAGRGPSRSALQILNERLAKGEIQKEEYAEKKAAILSGAPR